MSVSAMGTQFSVLRFVNYIKRSLVYLKWGDCKPNYSTEISSVSDPFHFGSADPLPG